MKTRLYSPEGLVIYHGFYLLDLFAFSPAANGHVATIELLLKEGADPSLKDMHGRDALTVACVKANEGSKDLVVQLLQVTSYM